jgi:hypothetical protein
LYAAGFKLQATHYSKGPGNRGVGRQFNPHKLKKLCMSGEGKRNNQRKQTREFHFIGLAAKWPELEEEVNNWVMDCRKNGISI